MLSCLFIAALWSPAGKGLTSWLSFVMFNCVFVTFPCGIHGQVWYLIVLIPDLCHLSYFVACLVKFICWILVPCAKEDVSSRSVLIILTFCGLYADIPMFCGQ